VYIFTMALLGVSVWAVAKFVSIPAGLGLAVYLLKPNCKDTQSV